MPGVSVVVPVRDAAGTLPGCLQALAGLNPAPLEILLLDNGSTDGSLAILRAFAARRAGVPTRVLEESRPGAAAARNAGIREARGDVVAFTDADCLPDAAWLEHLTLPFADPSVGAVAGRVTAAPPASTLELFSALLTLRSPEAPARHVRWTPWDGGFPTANLAVRRGLLNAVGGFDADLAVSGEDYDLCARLYEQGAAIAYTPEAAVAHRHRTTLRGLLRQAFGFGHGHAFLLRRHGGPGLWVDTPRHSLRWAGCPVRAWIDLAAADKKILAILGIGAAYVPALWLLPAYALWLGAALGRSARRAGHPASPAASLELAALLVAKSAAMTAGRWWGSAKYGACCL